MNEQDDLSRLSELIHMCADTMRLICRSQEIDGAGASLNEIARQLDSLSKEVQILAHEAMPGSRSAT